MQDESVYTSFSLDNNPQYHRLGKKDLHNEDLISLLIPHLKAIITKNSKATIITLTGGPASGKTTLSEKISSELTSQGFQTEFIATDGFNEFTREERNTRIKEGADPLSVKNWNLLKEIIAKVRAGEAVKAPEYDSRTGLAIARPQNEWKQLPSNLACLIIDGDFQPLDDVDYKMYFHVPSKAREEIRVQRDLLEREGYGDAAAIRKSFHARQTSQFYPHTFPHAGAADLIISVEPVSEQNNKGHLYKYLYNVFEK